MQQSMHSFKAFLLETTKPSKIRSRLIEAQQRLITSLLSFKMIMLIKFKIISKQYLLKIKYFSKHGSESIRRVIKLRVRPNDSYDINNSWYLLWYIAGLCVGQIMARIFKDE